MLQSNFASFRELQLMHSIKVYSIVSTTKYRSKHRVCAHLRIVISAHNTEIQLDSL